MQRLLVTMAAVAASAFAQGSSSYKGWEAYGGGYENIHYSSLKQITPANVNQLKVAWTYESGDAYPGSDIQCNPIIVGGVMYVTSPKLRVAAVDAATGKEMWSFDGLKGRRPAHKNRGLTYWTDGKSARILFALDTYLLSLDAKTGVLDPAFGEKGRVDLRAAFDRRPEMTTISIPTPGAIYKDTIILGSSVPESHPSTPGDILAYNVRTGKLQWSFHTIPHPGEPGYETWPKDTWKYTGGANPWAGLVVDVKRGLVFAPTGSAAYDFYGADRIGDNLYSNTILCLDANTGKKKWHFQTIRHDVWDLDFPTAPLLATVRKNGKPVDVVVAAGKDGFIWVLNRDTGESLFSFEERAVPVSNVEGEMLAKSQKFPLKPAPFVRQEFSEATVTNRSPEAHAEVMERLKGLDYGGRFTPPSLRGTVVFPGFAGGAEWGGEAFDPETHLYYINANELAWISKLVLPSQLTQRKSAASRIYRSRCGSCHGPDMKGAPPEYPALNGLALKMNATQLAGIIHKGSGRMPPFASLGDPAISALANYLLTGKDEEVAVERGPKPPVELKYAMDGYKTFTDSEGYPATTPPWGSLSAINLDTGEYVWKVPLGEYPELVEKGIKDTGTENHGGGIVTAGGLFFIASTHYDNKLRAFDKKTGKLVWETKLPHAGNATPSMFELKGKQYLVVPCGGGRERPSGGSFVAFALP
ncbi:MAG: PQQ-binding-like beta-propeller repeat protein [Bryobacteraceae bacterium]|nr:PQQ-binding-like beta-propeller repeat protein [Bryobacteraceae bacterium]